MSDIVERLLETAKLKDVWYANVGRKTAAKICDDAQEAAAEIKRLEFCNKELVEKLKKAAEK